MADQVDSMSDAELRTKLAEHGFPVMPITASTRKLLVKKLKSKSKPRAGGDIKVESRQKRARYSSGEVSDLDSTNNGCAKRARRATTGGAMPPPASSKARRATPKKDWLLKQEDKGSESHEEPTKSPVRTYEEVEPVTTRRVPRTHSQGQRYMGKQCGIKQDFTMADQVDSMSDAELRTKLAEHGFPVMPITASTRKLLVKKLKLVLDNKSKLKAGGDNKVERESRRTLARYSSGEESDLDSTNNGREKRGRRATTGGAMLPPASSKARRATPKKDSLLKQDSDKGSESHEEPTKSPVRTQYGDDYKTGSDCDVDADRKTTTPMRSNSRSSDYISSTLPTNDISTSPPKPSLFFRPYILISIYPSSYTSSLSYDHHLNSIRSRLGLTSTLGDRPSVSNYASNYTTSTYQPFTSTIDEVESPYLSNFTKRLSALKADPSKPTFADRDHHLNSIESWFGLTSTLGDRPSVSSYASNYTTSTYQLSTSTIDEVESPYFSNFTKRLSALKADPSKPTFADRDINNGSSRLLPRRSYISGIARPDVDYNTTDDEKNLKNNLVSLTKEEENEIYSMVEQIIDIISQETKDSGEPFISVDHVRDTLISPQNREKMSSIWDAAVKFIQRNESRVRMEVQSVDGEDCRVWRSAAWQRQAFETQEGSVNNLTVSPTPCLKIRHMFDKNDTNQNLSVVVQDAILEKCGERCNVLHVDVDRASCCVYVKCASAADAGVVYRSLHGWWYEGRLITVKYLRLERYMQRFPNSPTVGPFLNMSRPRRTWDVLILLSPHE